MKKILCMLGLVLILNLLAVPVVAAEEETFTFDEVVVTASKYEENLSETATSIEVVDQEEIQQKNAQNAADLLRDVASVQINDQAGIAGQKTVSIRGADSKHVLVLIDGQKMNNIQNGVVDLSQLPISQIEKIEVLKGPASAIYGANALGGVINIITKSGSEEAITTVDLELGSYDTQRYNLIHRRQVENLGYNVSISKIKSDGHRNNSELDQLNLFTKFNYELNNYSDLIMSLQHIESDKGVPGPSNDATPNAQQDDEDTNINLQWKRKSENEDLKVAIYYNEHNQIYDNPDSMWSPHNEHDTYKKGIELTKTDYYSAHTLTYGLAVENDRIDSTGAGEHEHLNKSLFINDDWQVGDEFKVNVGGRYDDHEKFDSNFSPRLGAVYTINPQIKWHTSIGEAYVTPNFNDLYWQPGGNPDLEPESAIAYETGVRFKNSVLSGEINYFKKDVDNLIAWDNAKDESYNINQAETSGVELILKQYITQQLSFDFNYTYLDARNAKSDKRLEDKPYHKANLDFIYDTTEITAVLSGEYTGKRDSSYWDPTTFSVKESVLPSNLIVDAKISKNFVIKGQEINLNLKVNNLFDKEYEVIEKYPMPEQNYMLSTEIKF